MKKHIKKESILAKKIKRRWVRFWMAYAGLERFGRFSTRMATLFALPHKASTYLAHLNPQGYIAPSAIIQHSDLFLGENILIGDRVIIYQAENGGPVEIGDKVHILRDSIIETGCGGYISIGPETAIHPRCQLNAYVAPIKIGFGVLIAPNCAFYSYDHGFALGKAIREQPLKTRGPITIGDEVWIGVGVIILSGVHIGQGAVVGAGSIVTEDIPDNSIVTGRPAKVVKMRQELS